MKAKDLLLALLLVIFINYLYPVESGFILDLKEPPFITHAALDSALSRLNAYSEFIYNPKKLNSDKVNSPESGPNPSFQDLYGAGSSVETWGQGQWGQGTFAGRCASMCFLYFTTSDGKITGDVKDYSNWYYSGGYYWGGRPLIRDSGRRVLSYIYLYKYYKAASRKAEARKCLKYIHEGMQYIVSQQRTIQNSKYYGTFINWQQRDIPDKINNSDVNSLTDVLLDTMAKNDGVNTYENAQAVMALSEGYSFIREIDPSNQYLNSYSNAIALAADYMLDDKHNIYSSMNYRAFYLHSFVCAYRITQDSRYLNRAVQIYLGNIRQSAISAKDSATFSPQTENGTWHIEKGNNFHDSYPFYTGIILWGLESLYGVIPDNSSFVYSGNTYDASVIRDYLKTNIIRSINHFLVKVPTVDDSTGGIRLVQTGPDTGKFVSYYGSKDYSGLQYGNELAIALYSALKSSHLPFSANDRANIARFHKYIVWSIINGVNSSRKIPANSDVQFQALSMYAYNGPFVYKSAATTKKVFFTLIPHKK
jgi:hypothetical protein